MAFQGQCKNLVHLFYKYPRLCHDRNIFFQDALRKIKCTLPPPWGVNLPYGSRNNISLRPHLSVKMAFMWYYIPANSKINVLRFYRDFKKIPLEVQRKICKKCHSSMRFRSPWDNCMASLTLCFEPVKKRIKLHSGGRHEIHLWKRPDRSQKDEEWKLTYLNYPVEKTRQKISDTYFKFGNCPTEKYRQCQNCLFYFCIEGKNLWPSSH